MLYDNGPLLAIYAQAAIATGESLFGAAANATADWLLADMRDDNGGFYATRDADSEGQEGLYYLWDPDEVGDLVGDDYDVFARRFGLDTPANFEGRWHLTVHEQVDDDETTAIERARRILLARRARRVAPARDEKQLTSWNALAIRGLAIAGRALERPDLVEAAARAVEFIRTNLVREGRLLACFTDGQAKFDAYLDDHAFLLDALLELLQARWDSSHLAFAQQVADLMLDHFADTRGGGFWFTADDHEALIHRSKPLADESVPSGNGIAACALQRLGFLLGETRYLDAAEGTLRTAWQALQEYPHGHVSLLSALEEYLEHPEIVVIRGEPDEIARWRDSAAKVYAPRRLVFAIPAAEEALPGALAERKAADGETIAYRCVGTHCELPVTTWEALAEQLTGE
ncbi:MAG: thioredoxin domain-containing protein, partial [Woeseiaceae bacterium]